MDTFVAAKRVADRHAATGLRRALAGCWTMEATTATCAARDAHATPAAGRQRALTDARHFGDRVRIEGAASGAGTGGAKLGVRVYPVGPLYLPARARSQTTARRPAGFVMGYALLGTDAIVDGARRLLLALNALESRDKGEAR